MVDEWHWDDDLVVDTGLWRRVPASIWKSFEIDPTTSAVAVAPSAIRYDTDDAHAGLHEGVSCHREDLARSRGRTPADIYDGDACIGFDAGDVRASGAGIIPDLDDEDSDADRRDSHCLLRMSSPSTQGKSNKHPEWNRARAQLLERVTVEYSPT